MRPQRGLALIVVVVTTILLTPHTAITPSREFADAACVRLPWQPKDKCKSSQVPRKFATERAKKEVAVALEGAYREVIDAFISGQEMAKRARQRNYGLTSERLYTADNRYQTAVLALGGLVDTYSQAVQPKQLAWFSPIYKRIQACFPDCNLDWYATLKP